MKKIISIVLVLTMVVSLTGCDAISGLLGGGGHKLEEGESYAIINADGELTVEMAISADMLDEDFNADIDDDPEDIMDDMQDMIDDELDNLDLKSDIEVTDVKVKDDIATVTIVAEDFEFLFPVCYETLADYADLMGGYEAIADMTPFITYEDEDELDDKDLEDYEDGTVLSVDGGEEGTYFEFDDDIAIVTDDMKFEMIKSNIIYVKGGDSGLIVLDGEVDCDPEFYGSIMGNTMPDMGNTMPDMGMDTTNESIVFNADGSCTKNLFVSTDDLYWYLEDENNITDAALQTAIDSYISDYFYNVELKSLTPMPDGAMVTIYSDDATNISYDYGLTVEDLLLWYDSVDDYSSYYSFVDYQTGAPLDPAALESMGNAKSVTLQGGYTGTTCKVPGNILYAQTDLKYERIDNNTIYLEPWAYGLIIFE